MCVVSMVVDGIRTQWPPMNTWPTQTISDTQRIIDKLAEIDRKLGLKDCYDPKKNAFLSELEALSARITVLENEACSCDVSVGFTCNVHAQGYGTYVSGK